MIADRFINSDLMEDLDDFFRKIVDHILYSIVLGRHNLNIFESIPQNIYTNFLDNRAGRFRMATRTNIRNRDIPIGGVLLNFQKVI